MAKKGNSLKFLEGAVAGLALGVAASLFLTSKRGKEIRHDVKEKMADFYKYIAPKVKKMKQMGEKEYKVFMKNAAMQYGKAKKFSAAATAELIKEAQKTWHHFSK